MKGNTLFVENVDVMNMLHEIGISAIDNTRNGWPIKDKV